MIGYITLGTNDIERAAKYYDALLAELDAKRVMETDNFIMWGPGPGQAGLCLTKPYNGNPASVGNGVMVAFAVGSPEKVHSFYEKAISLGSTDEGPPGPRGGGFYAGYVRDLDGNKLNAFCMTES